MAETAELRGAIKEMNDDDRADLLLDVISDSSVLWLSNFVKAFEERFGVSAAAPVAAVAALPGAGAAAAEPEKTEFDVVLTEVGQQKIQVIKAVRSITNLGLKEAKALVDKPGSAIKEGVSKEEAEGVQKELEAAGATAELK